MKKILALFLAILMIVSCGIALGDEIYGDTVDGDLLFNNIPWGTHKDDVLKFLKEKYSDIEIEVEENEYEYGDIKLVVCTYTNKQGWKSICKVGDMEVDKILCRYICEDGKYDNGLVCASYRNENYSTYKSMVEMLQHKYGNPYEYKKHTINDTYQKLDGNEYIWRNKERNQSISIYEADEMLDIGAYFGASDPKYSNEMYIEYQNDEMWDYYTGKRDLFEAKQKEDEIANKDYDGL